MGAVKPFASTETQQSETRPGNFRELWTVIFTLAVAATMTVLAGVVSFTHFGKDFLDRRYDAVGEALMKEGDRLADAGLDDRALERYEKALQARFAGGFNRSHTLKCAGRIRLQQGDPDTAIAYLAEAIRGAHADHGAYFYLVDALLEANRVDEAEQHNLAWMKLPEARERARDRARALYYAARIAEARGNIEEAIQLSEQSHAARPQEYVVRYMDMLRAKQARAQ